MSIPISKACCTIPAVVQEDYTPKGDYTEFDGMKTYITGPADSKRALLFVYDVFGLASQTLQGAVSPNPVSEPEPRSDDDAAYRTSWQALWTPLLYCRIS
jgi:hypothetical protein